jgi:hypothetical protein
MAARATVFSKRRDAVSRLFPACNACHCSSLSKKQRNLFLAITFLFLLCPIVGNAAGVKPETVAAFDRYVEATEAQMKNDAGPERFLVIDRLPGQQRQEVYENVRRGEFYIEELHTLENGQPIRMPSGLIHHWVGVTFIPNARLSETDAVLHDYANEASIYNPQIRRAGLVQQKGNESKIYLQFYSKSIITVVLDAYFDVVETRMGNDRIQSIAHSTRVVEVLNPGTPAEHARTDGVDHGYMWRLSSYWRIEEKDGGTYVENESITLTRTVPAMLAWIINPLTKSIPQDVLQRTLTDTRNAVLKNRQANGME